MPTRPRSPRVLLFPLLVLLAATLAVGCEQDPASGVGDLTTTIDTINAVVHIANSGTPPEWQLTQVVSIGPKSVTEQETPDEFGRVSAVALGPDGTVFVADAGNHEIRVFGLDGAHLRTFGREGEGPGEFESIYSIAWAGDRLLAFDPPLGRIGEFSADGEWLGHRRTTGGLTGTGIRFYTVGADEVFRFALGSDMESEWVGLDSRGDTGDTLPYLRDRRGPARGDPYHCLRVREGNRVLLAHGRGEVRAAAGFRWNHVFRLGVLLSDRRDSGRRRHPAGNRT